MSTAIAAALAIAAPVPSEAVALGVLRSLRPLQALNAGLRALPITPDRVDGGERSGAPCEHASDRGTLTAARVLSARLGRVHDPEARKTLAWLIDRAHVEAPLSVLAAAYAAEAAPVNDREVCAVAHANAQRLRSNADATARRARRFTRECRGAAAITPALAEAHAAVAQTEAAARSSEAAALRASRSLVAWGEDRILRAVAAWMAT